MKMWAMGEKVPIKLSSVATICFPHFFINRPNTRVLYFFMHTNKKFVVLFTLLGFIIRFLYMFGVISYEMMMSDILWIIFCIVGLGYHREEDRSI